MKVTLKRISGLAMAAVADSNHWVTMDGPEHLGGFDAGARPMELLLMGLAGCTAIDVVSILTKKRAKLADLSIEVEAQQTTDYPKVFSEIKLRYILKGDNLRKADVESALKLSEDRYCSAMAILRKTATIVSDYEIVESEASP